MGKVLSGLSTVSFFILFEISKAFVETEQSIVGRALPNEGRILYFLLHQSLLSHRRSCAVGFVQGPLPLLGFASPDKYRRNSLPSIPKESPFLEFGRQRKE